MDGTLDVVFSRFGWSLFTITLRQKPGEEFRAVGAELQDRESLFYADCAELLSASTSGLLWMSVIQILKRRHLVSYLFFLLIYETVIVIQKNNPPDIFVFLSRKSVSFWHALHSFWSRNPEVSFIEKQQMEVINFLKSERWISI